MFVRGGFACGCASVCLFVVGLLSALALNVRLWCCGGPASGPGFECLSVVGLILALVLCICLWWVYFWLWFCALVCGGFDFGSCSGCLFVVGALCCCFLGPSLVFLFFALLCCCSSFACVFFL